MGQSKFSDFAILSAVILLWVGIDFDEVIHKSQLLKLGKESSDLVEMFTRCWNARIGYFFLIIFIISFMSLFLKIYIFLIANLI